MVDTPDAGTVKNVFADQFRGLPMADLIGAPLMAACDAQVKLANATADFIKIVGFLPPKDGDDSKKFNDVRTARFQFDRPSGPIPEGGGEAPTETVALEVPLLALVKVPSLGITQVDITFDMEVKNSEKQSSSSDTGGKFAGDAKLDWGLFSVKVHVEGSVSSHQDHTRSSDQSAKYHVELQARDTGMPEGLSRVLDIVQSSIAPRYIAPTKLIA